MSLREVAPALGSMGRVLDEANSTLNDDAAKLDVHITAITAGSFEIAMELGQSATRELINVFSSDKLANAVAILSALFGSGGLIWLLKKLGGKKIEKPTDMGDGIVEIVTDTKETIRIPQSVLKLLENVSLRRSLSSVLRPLKAEGITSFHVRGNDEVDATVNESEVDYFDVYSDEENFVVDDVRTQIYGIASVAFQEGNKWRLLDGKTPIHAAIEDKAFLEKVTAGEEVFASGDMLKCEMNVKQRLMESGGLKTTYAVTRVIGHFKKPATPELFQ